MTRPDTKSAASVPDALDVAIRVEADIVRARSLGRDLCRDIGFSEVHQVKVATAISELARNIFHYAKTGTIALRRIRAPRPGIEVVATDAGPGIPDVKLVLSGAYKSKTGMGMGLLGARRLVDFFEVDTAPGRGTRVVLKKFVP